MPTYQYECLKCTHRFDIKQSFNDEPIASCPVCHGVARRLFSAVPILFKGSGFYITDSRNQTGCGLNCSEPAKKGKKSK